MILTNLVTCHENKRRFIYHMHDNITGLNATENSKSDREQIKHEFQYQCHGIRWMHNFAQWWKKVSVHERLQQDIRK